MREGNRAAGKAGDNRTLLDLYRGMVLTRAVDRAIAREDGHWHGCEGEEAVVAGTYLALRRGDVVAPHYRGSLIAAHAQGADLRRLIAGVFGKATSYSRGRYRTDVCGPPEFNVIGLYSGALGPPLSYAAGAALAAKLDGRDDIALGVFGDGTSSRGDCHEAMNLAGALKLPIVFVCQNNQIAISTPSRDGVSAPAIADRGAGYGMPGLRVDGNDVVAVHDAVQAAAARARAGKGPSLIEALTYRARGHFVSDMADPRPAEEVAAWRARDPVALFYRRLVDEGVIDAAGLDEIDGAVGDEVAAALAAALADPPAEADALGAATVYA